ncbi:MAG: Rz1-like lysis system protein LysC [Pontibacterium sp.]
MGCSGPKVIVKREVVPELPPVQLLVDIDQPVFVGRTYGDAVRFIPKLQASHQECSDRIVTIRKWSDLRRSNDGS